MLLYTAVQKALCMYTHKSDSPMQLGMDTVGQPGMLSIQMIKMMVGAGCPLDAFVY